MRGLLIAITLLGLLLAAFGGCESANDKGGGGSDSDSDSDGDSDSDSDTEGVPIEYPEAINHFMNPNGLLTGPISPPPEDVFGDEFDEADDWDAGEPDEEL
ncbi:MAG: hypothetical protein JRF63_00915 [Deltaproteobacteria bacterium]|nr:hypothetical protein [Deltaproteobacteria bacterium]